MSETLKVIYTPDEPDWKRFPHPTTSASEYAAGTIVEDERGIQWEVYWDEQDHQLEWQRAKAGAVPELDSRPHSRACGIRRHEHGPDCHSNCPTCAGRSRGTGS